MVTPPASLERSRVRRLESRLAKAAEAVQGEAARGTQHGGAPFLVSIVYISIVLNMSIF
jgi:hypothetical protein